MESDTVPGVCDERHGGNRGRTEVIILRARARVEGIRAFSAAGEILVDWRQEPDQEHEGLSPRPGGVCCAGGSVCRPVAVLSVLRVGQLVVWPCAAI